MVEIIKTISIAAYIASGVFFGLSVFFWFKFRILSIINDLSGRTAHKSIEQMRASQEKLAARVYVPTEVNFRRVVPVEELAKKSHLSKPATTKSFDQNLFNAPPTDVQAAKSNISETEVLGSTLYKEGRTTDIIGYSGETTVLTGVRNYQQAVVEPKPKAELTIIEEIMFIHTDEVI